MLSGGGTPADAALFETAFSKGVERREAGLELAGLGVGAAEGP